MIFRRKRDKDLDEELQSHLRMAAQDRMDRGESLADAEAAARRELGNTGLIKEVAMEVTGGAWFERLLQDMRYSIRVMRRNMGATVVSVLTLTLGIGASTAIFSVVYGVLLRPLPYEKPEQIVRVWEVSSKGAQMQFADPNFTDFRAQNRALQGLAEFASWPLSVSGGSEPKRLMTASVSSDFFPILRVKPVLGRGFVPEDQHFGAVPVVMVSYNYWKQYLGGAGDLSSLKLNVGDRSSSVVGVLPPRFRFPDGADLWSPREIEATLPSRDAHNWQVIGRLRDGVTLEQARTDLSAIARKIKQQYGQDAELTAAAVFPLREALTSDVRPRLLILLVAVGFLLLVGCANVMNLMLSQAAAREGELAVRAALGASRTRLVRQFLAETLLLSSFGGVLGVLAAYFGVRVLLSAAPSDVPRLSDVSVNIPVLLFAAVLCVVVAAVLGVFIALRATAGDVRSALVEGGRGQASGMASQRLGRTIVAGQLAVTLVLLVGAGLMGRSLLRALSIDPGFRTEHVITMDLALPGAFENDQKVQRAEFINELFMRLRRLPGVEDVGGTNALPLETGVASDGTYAVLNPQQLAPATLALMDRAAHGSMETDPVLMKELVGFLQGLFRDPAHTGYADYVVASEGYFRALGIPLRSGRLFDDRDAFDAPHAALISESLARAQWPGQDPIGRTIEFGNMDGDLRLLTVVGVVGDVRERSLEHPPRPTIYVNYRQRPQATARFSVVMRSSAAPGAILPEARKIVHDLDPNVPPSFSTFTRVFAASLNTRRFNLLLVGLFAVTALCLAVAGIYGVLSYSVARRTREMGVRIALGASVNHVLKLVLKQAMRTALAGVLLGMAGAFVLTRLMQSVLFDISPTDPLTFSGVAALLLLVAFLAAYVPARRATRVDPMIALRYE